MKGGRSRRGNNGGVWSVLLRNTSLLYCETPATIISTVTSNNNNSHLHETFHLNGTQSLEGSEDRCVRLTSRRQTWHRRPFCRQWCRGSKIQLLPWSFPVRRDGPESLTGLRANKGGLSPKSSFSSMKRRFFCAAPLKNVLAEPRRVHQAARCGDSALCSLAVLHRGPQVQN